MKKFTLIVVLIISSAGWAFAGAIDTTDRSGKNQIDDQGLKQGWWVIRGNMRPDAGYDANAKIEEGMYKDNLKAGVWIAYFPDGKKKNELTYVNNRPNGHAVMYNDNDANSKSEEGTWVGTRWTGDYKLYYPDGTPRQSFNYNPVGQRSGDQTYYHPNGKVAIKVTMKNGHEDGWKQEYDDQGNLVQETFFADGVIDPSKTKTYSTAKTTDVPPEDKTKQNTPPPPPPNNAQANQGTFTGEGYWVLYQNGQISMKGTFHNKRIVDGEQRIYNPNGLLVEIKQYKGGKYVGDAPIPADANK